MLRAGKAMNEKGVIVRIQLRGGKTPLFGNIDLEQQRDEFVMRLQPGGGTDSRRGLVGGSVLSLH